MKNDQIFKYTLGLVVMMIPTLVVAASVEAKKESVEVYSSADKASAVVGKLKMGDVVNAGDRSGMYWQVKLPSGAAGYVSVLQVRVKTDAAGGINDAIREAVKAGRANGDQDGARSRSAVMGVRGLDDTSDTANAGSVKPNLRAVFQMEDRVVSVADLDRQGEIVGKEIEAKLKRN